MKKIIILALLVMLASCATVKSWIPSFSDPNQSHRIVDVRLAIEQLDCSQPHLPQAKTIRDHVMWFELYSHSAGWRHQDVLRVLEPIKESVADFYRRSEDQQGSEAYCAIKKKLLRSQAQRAAEAILGRF
jgi:hypothetical protein